jgi:hypothetical protein
MCFHSHFPHDSSLVAQSNVALTQSSKSVLTLAEWRVKGRKKKKN